MTVVLENISKVFKGQLPAVNNLNLSIARGEILSLLGPSGCGKTTILRIIAGFERPTEGWLKIDGVRVAGGAAWVPPEKRKIGMVFQDYALFPHLNVFQNISFGLRDRDKATKEIVTELVETVGLAGLEKRFPHQLSGGQQQRVALARALARRPLLLLLDEPFSNLDAVLRQDMREEIKSIIKKAAVTAVLVTHDLQDALAVADRIVVMKNGEIQQVGLPEEIYTRPGNKFVAAFLNRFSLVTGLVTGSNRVSTDFGEVFIALSGDVKIGQEVCLGVPPQGVKISPKGQFTGRVKYVSYIGDKWEVGVEALGKGVSAGLKVFSNFPGLLAAGQRVRLDLDMEATVLLYD